MVLGCLVLQGGTNKFLTKTDKEFNMQVSFGNRKIATVQGLKFWGLTIDTTLT